MFTGIVSALGTLRAIKPLSDGADMRLVIGAPCRDRLDRHRASIGCSAAA